MKKLLSILMAAAMLLSLCALTACGEKPAEDAAGDNAGDDTNATTELVTTEAGKLHMSTNATFPTR